MKIIKLLGDVMFKRLDKFIHVKIPMSSAVFVKLEKDGDSVVVHSGELGICSVAAVRVKKGDKTVGYIFAHQGYDIFEKKDFDFTEIEEGCTYEVEHFICAPETEYVEKNKTLDTKLNLKALLKKLNIDFKNLKSEDVGELLSLYISMATFLVSPEGKVTNVKSDQSAFRQKKSSKCFIL